MSLPWYPRFPREFLASNFVAQLTYEEIGIYTILMDRAWLDDHCSVPADRAELANLVKGAPADALERVLTKWSPHPTAEGRLINETIYEHWLKANEKAAKARRAVQIRWDRYKQNPPPPKKKRAAPQGPTGAEFERVDKMVETWNANAHASLPKAQYAAQAQAQGKKMAARIRAHPWLYDKFGPIVRAAMLRYSSMISNHEAGWLKFLWFATGPLDKIEALRDAELPLAQEGAPTSRL